MSGLILASASPRRAKLLQQAGYAFEVRESTISREEFKKPPPRGVELLALEKARDVAGNCSDGVVLGADTVVIHRGKILGKPCDAKEAEEMLNRLKGERHKVITGIAIVDASGKLEEITDHVVTQVWMRHLEYEEISGYIRSREPLDKAGAYGIQGFAAVFVERIDGCFFNVVGLPLSRVYFLLFRYGIKPTQ